MKPGPLRESHVKRGGVNRPPTTPKKRIKAPAQKSDPYGNLIHYLDIRITKAQSQLEGRFLSVDERTLEIEVKLLTDLRDGLIAGDIPNSRGLSHKESNV